MSGYMRSISQGSLALALLGLSLPSQAKRSFGDLGDVKLVFSAYAIQ